MNLGLFALTVILLLANGFFVAVEFALIASRRTKLEGLAEAGDRRAAYAIGASRELSLQLAGAQLGITMASLALGAVAEPAIADTLERAVGLVADVPEGVLHTISLIVALTIVVFLHMVVGEMVPKNIAIAAPERTLLVLARSNRAYVTVFRPVIRLLNAMANGVLRLLRVEPRDELAITHTADEIAAMLAASREEGLIEEVAHDLLTGALDFGEKPIRSVMVPREEVVAVSRDASLASAEQAVIQSGRSRLPVLGRDIDDVVGFVHAKDLLTLPPDAQSRPIPQSRIRRILVVGEDRPLDEVLVAMRRARSHLAVVVGEDGGTVGIATLEDLLEALVGDIRDESDPEAAPNLRRRRRSGADSP